MNQFLYFVAAITFFGMSDKHNVSGQSTFYTGVKTLEKSTHFMLTHVVIIPLYFIEDLTLADTAGMLYLL